MDRKLVRRQALVAALRTLSRFGVSKGERVDVFGLLRSAGIVVAFRPMPRLAGAYLLSDGGLPGVIINNNHPLSKQRFTAAHELGHHVLEHGERYDISTELTELGEGVEAQEVGAEAFAGFLLAPRELLVTLTSSMSAGCLTAVDCYRVSLEIGISYQATATQLYVYDLISRRHYRDLVEHVPAKIKRQIIGDPHIALGTGDVIELRPDRRQPTIVQPGDLLLLRSDGLAVPSLGPGLEREPTGARGDHIYHRVRVARQKPVNPSEASRDSGVSLEGQFFFPLIIEHRRSGIHHEDILGE